MARSYQPELDFDDYDLSEEEDDPSFLAFLSQMTLQKLGRAGLSAPSQPSAPPSVAPAPVMDPRLTAFQGAYNKSRFYHSTAGQNVPSLLEHGITRDLGKDQGLDKQHGLSLQPGFNFLGGDRDTAKYYRRQVGAGADTVRAFVGAEDYEYVVDDLGSDSLADSQPPAGGHARDGHRRGRRAAPAGDPRGRAHAHARQEQRQARVSAGAKALLPL